MRTERFTAGRKVKRLKGEKVKRLRGEGVNARQLLKVLSLFPSSPFPLLPLS
jgi:hypothetical protein